MRTPETETTVIGKTLVVEGDIEGQGAFVVYGRVRGTITTSGEVAIESDGVIEGDVVAESVRVAGRVMGNIRASSKLEIARGASVNGDLHAPRVQIADGARLEGKIDMS